jgi:hypothetical protein
MKDKEFKSEKKHPSSCECEVCSYDKKQTEKGLKDLGSGESKDPITGYTEKEALEKKEMASRRQHLKSRR